MNEIKFGLQYRVEHDVLSSHRISDSLTNCIGTKLVMKMNASHLELLSSPNFCLYIL